MQPYSVDLRDRIVVPGDCRQRGDIVPGNGMRSRLTFGALLLIACIATPIAARPFVTDSMDPDCFWHLCVAEQLKHDGIGPLRDHLCFASTSTKWAPYSWLAELGMRWLWDHTGWRGAIVTQGLVQFALIAFIAAACGAAADSPAPAISEGAAILPGGLRTAVATVFASILAQRYLSFRPVTAALMLLSLCALLIVRDRRHGERSVAVWAIVPLTALIINLHFYALFVPLWILAFLVGAAWERYGSPLDKFLRLPGGPDSDDQAESSRRLKRYTFLFAATLLACCATPMLPGTIAVLLNLQFSNPMVAGHGIDEFQPFYVGWYGIFTGVLVAAAVTRVVICFRSVRAGELAWLALSLLALFRMGRFAPVFALAAAPICAAVLPALSDRLLGRPIVWAMLIAFLTFSTFRIAHAFPESGRPLETWLNRPACGTGNFPCAAADFVDSHVNRVSGHLINEFNWGGYLEWRLGARYQTLMDGRIQIVSSDFWRATYLADNTRRRDFLATVQADAAILPAHYSLFHNALTQLGWRSAFHDDDSEVLLPPEFKASPE